MSSFTMLLCVCLSSTDFQKITFLQYGSAKNLEIIPPPNEDTSKEDCSAPPSPSEESEPTSMDVQLQPHSSPIKDATLPNDVSYKFMVKMFPPPSPCSKCSRL